MKLARLLMADCKTTGDVQAKLKRLFAGTIEQMLEVEMDEHLGYEKNSVAVMSLKNGLYFFPESEEFSVHSMFLGGFSELGTGNAEELLVDFLDYDFSRISSIVRNIDSISGEEIFDTINDFAINIALPFLIKLMTDCDWAEAFEMSPENWGDKFKAAVLPILDSIISTHNNAWEFNDYYCEYYGSAEERFDFFHALEEQFTTMAVEEIISARKPGRDFFSNPSKDDYCFPLILERKCRFFEKL